MGIKYSDMVAGFTAKAAAVAADVITILDSAASFAPKRLTFAEFKAALGFREKLTGPRTLYVRTDGNDSNTGLANTAAGAFLTLQRAEDAAAILDNAGFDVTIQVAAGTYTTNVNLRTFVGNGAIRFVGNNTTPSSVVLQASSGAIFNASSVLGLHNISGFTFTGAGAIGVVSSGNSRVETDNIRLGPLTYGFFAIDQGLVSVGKTEIAGSMPVFMLGANQGNLQVTPGSTVTLTGTPNFSSAFVAADRQSFIGVYGVTFTGSATGTRFKADTNAVVFVNGAGATYLPGNANGTPTTGGQYA